MRRSVFLASLLSAISLLNAADLAADTDFLRVNGVTVGPANSLGEAEHRAKLAAIAQVLDGRGRVTMPAQAETEVISLTDEIVSIRHVLNTKPVDGLYQPTFYFLADIGKINNLVRRASLQEIEGYDRPRFMAAMSVTRLPKEFDERDISRLSRQATGNVGSALHEVGFEIEKTGNRVMERLDRGAPIDQVENIAFRTSRASYMAIGQINIRDDNVNKRDGGSYYHVSAQVEVNTYDTISGNMIPGNKTLAGTGINISQAVENAVENATKFVVERINGPGLIVDFKRHIKDGLR